MKNILRVHALWLASALILLFGPMSAEAQKALVYCPAVDQSGCTIVKSALTSAFPGGVDMGDDGTNGTIDLRTADLFQYALFFVPRWPRRIRRLRTRGCASRSSSIA